MLENGGLSFSVRWGCRFYGDRVHKIRDVLVQKGLFGILSNLYQNTKPEKLIVL